MVLTVFTGTKLKLKWNLHGYLSKLCGFHLGIGLDTSQLKGASRGDSSPFQGGGAIKFGGNGLYWDIRPTVGIHELFPTPVKMPLVVL